MAAIQRLINWVVNNAGQVIGHYPENIGTPMIPVATLSASGPGSTGSRSLISKIKASIAAAERNNPVESLPWLPPASVDATSPGNLTRANSKAYIVGATFANAALTHMFVVRVAGTTAASEPASVTNPVAASAPYGYGDITDGTATLQWIGPVRVPSAQPGAPSVYSGSLPAALSRKITFNQNQPSGPVNPVMRFAGGMGAQQSVSFGDQTYVRGPLAPGNGWAQVGSNYGTPPPSAFVEFETDAPLLGLDMSTGGTTAGGSPAWLHNIEIDNRRLCDGWIGFTVTTAAAAGVIFIDFRASGGRRKRKFRIALNGANGASNYGGFGWVWTTPQDTFWFPNNPNRFLMVCEGDSLFQGSASGPFISRWDRASIFADLIGCDNVSNVGVGATGFIANGSGAAYTYIQRLPAVAALNPDVLYLAGPYNDRGQPNATLQAAMFAYYQQARSLMPNTMIVQAGFAAGLDQSSQVAVEAICKAAVAQQAGTGDTNIFFTPAATDSPPWISGTNAIQGSPSGSGNSEIYIGTTDTTHPSQLGVVYLGAKDTYAFKNLVNSIT